MSLGQVRVGHMTYGYGVHHGIRHWFVGTWVKGSKLVKLEGVDAIVAEHYPSTTVHQCPHCSACAIAVTGDPMVYYEGKRASRLGDGNYETCPGWSHNITASTKEYNDGRK